MKTRLEGIDVLCGVAAPWSERLVAAARLGLTPSLL